MLLSLRFVALLLVSTVAGSDASGSAAAVAASTASPGSSTAPVPATPLISVNVKVIEGVDGAGVVGSGANSDSGLDPLQSHPDPMYGPEALFPLAGQCFCEGADRMDYCLCPFRNVTMRRVTGGRATLLGVFGSWLENRPAHEAASEPSAAAGAATIAVSGAGNLVMEFFRGQGCGQGARRTSVEIVPDSADYSVDAASIEENPACHTQMRLRVPLPRELLMDPALFLARSPTHHDSAHKKLPVVGGGAEEGQMYQQQQRSQADLAAAAAVASPPLGHGAVVDGLTSAIAALTSSSASVDRSKLPFLEMKVRNRLISADSHLSFLICVSLCHYCLCS